MIDPTIALNLKTPAPQESPLAMYGQVMSLRALGQQQQLQQQQLQAAQLENAQRQIGLDDQTRMREAWQEANGDGDKLMTLATQKGVSPGALMSLQNAILEQKTKRATLSKTDQENSLNLATRLQSRLAPIAQETDATKQAALWNQGLAEATQAGEMSPQDAQAHPYPGPDGVKKYVAGLNWEKWTLSQQQQATAAQRQTEADIAREKQTNEAPGQVANATAAALKTYAPQLAAASDQASYTQALGNLPKKYADRFPAQYDRAAILKAGETPAEIIAQEQAATNAGETQRHNRVEEGQGAQRNSIEAGHLAIDRARYGLDVNGRATQAGAMARGIVSPETARQWLRNNPGLLAEVQKIDPNFDEANLDNRYQTLQEFTNTSAGKAGGQVLALNTMMHHAQLYQETAQALKNGTFKPGNAVYNEVKQAFGAEPPTDAKLVAQFFASETGKLATGGVPAEGEIKQILDNMSTNGSPEAMAGAAKTLMKIGIGRAVPLQERVNQAKLNNVVQVLGPDARAIVAAQGYDPDTLKPAGAKPATSPAPAAPKPAAASAPRAPRVGTVDGGFVFMGGDPGNKSNWKKAQ